MTPIRTSACNTTLTWDGPDLPASRGRDGMVDFISTYWKPSDEERAMIAAGMPIKLSILGTAHPPVAIEVDTL